MFTRYRRVQHLLERGRAAVAQGRAERLSVVDLLDEGADGGSGLLEVPVLGQVYRVPCSSLQPGHSLTSNLDLFSGARSPLRFDRDILSHQSSWRAALSYCPPGMREMRDRHS